MSAVDKLAYLKRKHHMTTTALSERSGVPIGTLNKILSGATQNPALKNMDCIANVFNVPLRYLLDDTIPENCDMKAFAEDIGLVTLSAEELALLRRYRALPEHDRGTLTRLMDSLIPMPKEGPDNHPRVRKLPCYVPVAEGLRGAFGDSLRVRYLLADYGAIILQSDFAVMLTGQSMEPVYGPNTVLGVKARDATHNQLGVFLLNREGFIRKLYDHRGVRKLIATNANLKDIIIQEEDELRCMGVVVGALRSFRWA